MIDFIQDQFQLILGQVSSASQHDFLKIVCKYHEKLGITECYFSTLIRVEVLENAPQSFFVQVDVLVECGSYELTVVDMHFVHVISQTDARDEVRNLVFCHDVANS
jgi:hypothetical protein